MELFDVIDSKGNPTGQIASREKAHAEGIPHRTAHIWIILREKKRGEYRYSYRNDHRIRIPFRENLILLLQVIFRQEMNHWNLHFGN